ncbi:hypothetical protein KHA80_09285 [Anaerobacillus sp. HL2]|nr:hypothetical protein KHA80_09285 [Anaerobacillus sp. HL2]
MGGQENILEEGINVDDKIKRIFRVALEKYYLTTNENKLTDAYKMMIKEFYAEDIYFENGVRRVKIRDEEKLLPLLNLNTGIRRNTLFQKPLWLEKAELKQRKIIEHC